MGTIEFEVGFINGKLIYDGKVTLPIEYDGYIKTIISPGFSDAHAHPQVIDVGERSRYKNSYDWIMNRNLTIDEKGIREDPDISSKLALSTILISIFEGITFLALTGNAQGNIMAIKQLPHSPKVVLQPTILDRRGWLSPDEYLLFLESLALENENVNIGLFLHSLGLASIETINKTIRIARERGLIIGIHLSEGVQEANVLREITILNDFNAKHQLVAVHCFSEPANCRRFFRGVVSCPISNLFLYGRTINSPRNYDALGSDWPLLTGSVRVAINQAYSLSGKRVSEVLKRATLGGYELYDVGWNGDAVLFDSDLVKVLTNESELPSYVFVNGKKVINEKTLNDNFNYSWANDLKREVIKEAFEKYGRGNKV